MNNPFYDKFKDLFDFADGIIKKDSCMLNGNNPNDTLKKITLMHFSRSICLLDSIRILCINGRAIEARVNLRSFLNLVINISWLNSQNSDCYWQRYADFEVVLRKQYYELTKPREEDIFRHEEEFKKVEKKYKISSIEKNIKWADKSIYKMAEETKLEKDYKIIYRHLSEIEHT